jgi:hypothetical protein
VAELLARADAAARSERVVTARDNQFVYTRSAGHYEDLREVWLSVDGSRTGLLLGEGSTTPLQSEQHKALPVLDEAIQYPTFRSLSRLDPATAPAALLARIHQLRKGQGNDPDYEAFDALRTMLSETMAQAPARALIYRTAASIPGAKFVPKAKDGIGRTGPALMFDFKGDRQYIIVDPVTTAFRGEQGGGELLSAIVDKVGQRPAGAAPSRAPSAAPADPNGPASWFVPDIDWRNTAVPLPKDPHIQASYRTGGVILHFKNGQATGPGPDGKTWRYSLDLDQFPVVYGDQTARKGEDAIADAYVTIAIRQTASSDPIYEVVAYLGSDRTGKRPPQALDWMNPHSGGPTINAAGKNVTVTRNKPGSVPRHYRWDGTTFVVTD